jgi:hypothetical protein
MDVPFDATTAPRAAIVLGATGPWRLVEPDLIDLPDAAQAGEEGERHLATDRQQLGWPDDQHALGPAGRTVVTRAAAADPMTGFALCRKGRNAAATRPSRFKIRLTGAFHGVGESHLPAGR